MPTSNPTINTLVNNAAASTGADPNTMYAILNAENPSLDPNAVSYTGVQGLAQITHATWKTVNGSKPYSLDPADQLNTQAQLVSKYQNAYNNNVSLIAAAYNGGPGVANQAQRLLNANPNLSVSQAISMAAANIYSSNPKKQTEIDNYVAKVAGTTVASTQNLNAANATPAGEDSTPWLTVNGQSAVTALGVNGAPITADQLDAVNNAIAPALIINTGLGQPSWLDDPNILQVNGPTEPIGNPVVFQIFFQDGGSPLPIAIPLMASIRTHQKSMRHVMTKQKTRTGLLVNLWGMACDQITGQASTGMMANQLGLTDFLSLSTAPAYLTQAVLDAYQSSSQSASDILPEAMNNEGFFRIAAKDAFVEFLAMFKNNGTVWFQNQNYTGVTTQQDQTAADAWSPNTGSSTFQNVSRRNDVRTRGRVVMYFRNAQYSGYFKSLSWVMDAKSPFRWNFNFVFQVESTLLNVDIPVIS